MNIRVFRSVLERLEKLYASAGARTQAKDIRSVSSLLDGHENKTVEAYVAETRAAIRTDDQDRGRHVADPEAYVTEHAQRLLDAGTDEEAFDAALTALDNDDRANKSAWFAIANRYRNQPTGGTSTRKFRSIKDARQAIRDVFLDRFDARSKRRVIDKLTKRA
jgi:hypothetical protein